MDQITLFECEMLLMPMLSWIDTHVRHFNMHMQSYLVGLVDLQLDPNLYLHPFFGCVSREGSDENAWVRMLF